MFHHPIAQLVALKATLNLDKSDYDSALRRDRQISLDSNAITAQEQLRAWLNSQSSREIQDKAARAVFSWHIVQLVCLIVGAVLGLGVSVVALSYDGSQPINIIQAWLVLVGLPFCMMVFWLLSILPVSFPGLRFLSTALQNSVFKPLTRRLSHYLHSEALINHFSSNNLAFSLFSSLMQWTAFGFALACFLGTFYTLASTDLAFVWSSSLGIEETMFKTITDFIARPFSSWVTGSAPSLELIHSSHYFRFEDVVNNLSHSSDIGQTLAKWWPFLLASMGVYVLLPRMITLIIATSLCRRALDDELRNLPGYAPLLARMNAPLVSATLEHTTRVLTTEAAPVPQEVQFSLNAPLVNWGQIECSEKQLIDALSNKGFTFNQEFSAGGKQSTSQDNKAISDIQKLKPDGLLLLLKAWEPPLLEFKDWLIKLRLVVSGPVVILLIDPDNPTVKDSYLNLWRNDLHTLSDPKLYIEALTL